MRLILLAGLAAVLAGCGSGKDKPAKGIPDDWTHRELIAHLRDQGLKYAVHTTNLGSYHGPAAYFAAEGSPAARDERAASNGFSDRSPDVLYCQLRRSAQETRDQVGLLDDRGFASGRFIFEGDPKHLERVRAALP
jgi:hypothetical protein